MWQTWNSFSSPQANCSSLTTVASYSAPSMFVFARIWKWANVRGLGNNWRSFNSPTPPYCRCNQKTHYREFSPHQMPPSQEQQQRQMPHMCPRGWGYDTFKFICAQMSLHVLFDKYILHNFILQILEWMRMMKNQFLYQMLMLPFWKRWICCVLNWVVPEIDPHLPHRGNLWYPEGGWVKFTSDVRRGEGEMRI